MFEKYLQYFVIKGIILYMDKKQLTITLSIIGGVLAGGAVAIGAVAVTLTLLGIGKNS